MHIRVLIAKKKETIESKNLATVYLFSSFSFGCLLCFWISRLRVFIKCRDALAPILKYLFCLFISPEILCTFVYMLPIQLCQDLVHLMVFCRSQRLLVSFIYPFPSCQVEQPQSRKLSLLVLSSATSLMQVAVISQTFISLIYF